MTQPQVKSTTIETLDIAIGFWGLVRLALGLAIRAQASEPVTAAGKMAQ